MASAFGAGFAARRCAATWLVWRSAWRPIPGSAAPTACGSCKRTDLSLPAPDRTGSNSGEKLPAKPPRYSTACADAARQLPSAASVAGPRSEAFHAEHADEQHRHQQEEPVAAVQLVEPRHHGVID